MRRTAAFIGGLIGYLGLTGGLSAADLKDGIVRVPNAEVRGGRSAVFPITGTLQQGQRVRIVSEEGGYYAILPPAGSSSWIEDNAVKPEGAPGARRPDRAYVLLNNVVIRLGSDRAPLPLPYETTTLNRGTIVRIIGDKAFADGKEWWRIEPPPTEKRYVAKESLTLQTSTVVASSPAGTAGTPHVAGPQSTNPKWTQAQLAEQVRDYSRAELLYRELAGEMAQPGGDHDLAIRCYNRIEQLTRARLTTWPARQQAPGMLVSARPVSSAPAPVTAVPAPNSGQGNPITSGPGWLQRTGVLIDGRPALVLVDNRGQGRYYAMPVAGQSLDSFVGRSVELTGPFVRRSDIAAGGYISVTRVQILR
jgi:hypothetical protein